MLTFRRYVREMARHHAGNAVVGDTLARVIGRPDEIGEFVALYRKTSVKRHKQQPRIPKSPVPAWVAPASLRVDAE